VGQNESAVPSAPAPKPRYTLVVNRFAVNAELAENAICGNGNENGFEVSCRVTARGLDGDGFVVEVQDLIASVRRAFDRGMLKASCEELAGGVIHIIHAKLGTRLAKASAAVINKTGRVEIVWEEGEEVPAFPRTATTQEERDTRRARNAGRPRSSC